MTTITLDEVAEYLEQWKQYTGYGMALCVFHDDHNPSMRVWDTGFKCQQCGEKGSLHRLYEKVSGRVILREKKSYNSSAILWRNWHEKFGSVQNIAKVAHQNLLSNPNSGHYLKQRGIDDQIKKGKLGFLDGYYTFPVHNEYEQIEGLVARASPTIQTKSNRYTVSEQCPVKLYVPDWRRVRNDEYLYVCYGTIDAWTLYKAGFAGITGISGQELSFTNLDRFRKPMFIIPDKGEEKSALELQCKLGWRGMSLFPEWPEGTKDLNGVHTQYGIEKVKELIEIAQRRYNYHD